MKRLFSISLCFLFLIVNPIFSQVDLKEGLVGHYRFDGNALDHSGNDNNAIVNGADLTEDCMMNIDKAYQFDGIDDYIEIPHSKDLDFDIGQPFTISIWIKPEFNDEPTNGADILSKWNSAHLDTAFSYSIRIRGELSDDPGIMIFSRFDRDDCNHNSGFVGENAVSFGEWHNVIIQHDGNETLSLFINGVFEASTTDISECSLLSESNILIGHRSITNQASKKPYKGGIDELRFYNRAINQFEIDSLQSKVLSSTVTISKDVGIEIFPNPTNQYIKVIDKNEGRLIKGSVYDSSGKLVGILNDNQYNFNKSKGIYFILIENESGILTKHKVIVQ